MCKYNFEVADNDGVFFLSFIFSTRAYKSLSLKLRMDGATKTLWGFLHQDELSSTTVFKPEDLWCKSQVEKQGGKFITFYVIS